MKTSDLDTCEYEAKGTKRHRLNRLIQLIQLNRYVVYAQNVHVNVSITNRKDFNNINTSSLALSRKDRYENDALFHHKNSAIAGTGTTTSTSTTSIRHDGRALPQDLSSHRMLQTTRSYNRAFRSHGMSQMALIMILIQVMLTLDFITSFIPTSTIFHHNRHLYLNHDSLSLRQSMTLTSQLSVSSISSRSKRVPVPSSLYMNSNNNHHNNNNAGSDSTSNPENVFSSTNVNGAENHKNNSDNIKNHNFIHHSSNDANGSLLTTSQVTKATVTSSSSSSSSSSLPKFSPPTSSISSSFSSLASSIAMLTEDDQNQLSYYWSSKLLPHLSYLNPTNHSIIYQALQIAYISHKNQFRKSGEPFIIHPIEVTILLSSLQMDVDTLIAGLLHDTVEDTDLTFNQIESLFGTTVRNIVEGETKVSKLPSKLYSTRSTSTAATITSSEDEQAENLRQMFIAMTNDYRIIIVKLADRLHNMRTLEHMKPAKQQKISKETLDIFAPLAHRMGIWNFKSELEDLSFYYLFPNEYKHLRNKLDFYSQKWNETLEYSKERLIQVLKEDKVLNEQCIDITVNGRTKELYSLYCKMMKKEEDNLDHITDVVALRVVLEPMKKKKKTRSMASSSSSSSEVKTNGSDEGVDEDDNNEDYEYEYEEEYNNEPDCGVWLCYHVLGLVQHLPGFQPVPTKVRRRKKKE
jgi:hypothetical protein